VTTALVVVVWSCVSLPVAVLIGKAIERTDQAAKQPGRPWVAGEGYVAPTDVELWEAELRHPSGRRWTA
jgi:hypothetical protein